MTDPADETRAYRASRLPVRVLLEAADEHDGVLTRAQLLELGMSGSAISRGVERGLLRRRATGVYSVGRHRLTQRGRHRAALLAVGPGACLSHFAAAEHLGLLDGESLRIDVMTTARGLRGRDGVRVHCVRRLEPDEVVVHRGLRVTSVAKTLLDLAALVGRGTLMGMCARAAATGRYDRLAILGVLGRGRRGSRALRSVLATLAVGDGHTREELEHAFRRLIVRHGIAAPVFNDRLVIGGRVLRPDAHWRAARFVVELDSRRWHGTEPGFFRDREKDLAYAEHGLDHLRLTWRQVVGEEARVARILLARVGARV